MKLDEILKMIMVGGEQKKEENKVRVCPSILSMVVFPEQEGSSNDVVSWKGCDHLILSICQEEKNGDESVHSGGE